MKGPVSILVALAASATSDGLAQDATGDLSVYLRSVGPFEIGMPLDRARSVLAEPEAYLVQALRQRSRLPREADDAACGYLVSSALPGGMDLMFQFGRLVRIDIREGEIATASGARIGDAESRILEIYGDRITVRQHHYPPIGAHYMIFTPRDAADADYSLLFETDGTVVTRYRVGTKQAVEAPEGCA